MKGLSCFFWAVLGRSGSITDCICVSQTQTQAQAGNLESTTKPPDMSIFKTRSQLESYISALGRWATTAKTSGMAETLLADIILTYMVGWS